MALLQADRQQDRSSRRWSWPASCSPRMLRVRVASLLRQTL
jgi:hypothetical protein